MQSLVIFFVAIWIGGSRADPTTDSPYDGGFSYCVWNCAFKDEAQRYCGAKLLGNCTAEDRRDYMPRGGCTRFKCNWQCNFYFQSPDRSACEGRCGEVEVKRTRDHRLGTIDLEILRYCNQTVMLDCPCDESTTQQSAIENESASTRGRFVQNGQGSLDEDRIDGNRGKASVVNDRLTTDEEKTTSDDV